MTRRAWGGVRAGGVARASRPAGSWDVALARAREVWDGLTGGPALCRHHAGTCGSLCKAKRRYSDAAAGAIVGLAVALWGDVAASMGEPPTG